MKTPSNNQFPAFLLTLCFVFLTTFGCSAQTIDRTFPLSNFDRLDIGSAFTITVRAGSGFSVRATGRQQDLDEMEARVSGSTLKMGFKSSSWWRNRNHKDVRIEITMPALHGVDFSGASNASVSGFRNQGRMEAKASGASNVKMTVDADELTVDCSGASEMTLTGRADRLRGEVSGASDLKAFDLVSKTATLEASGASSAKLYVTGSLQADASGASGIRYKGNASVVKHTSGASDVKQSN